MTDPWAPSRLQQPDRRQMRHPKARRPNTRHLEARHPHDPRQAAAGEPAAVAAPEVTDGFETAAERARRLLRSRPATPWPAQLAAGIGRLFRGDDFPDLIAEAAHGAQAPVTTGRRLAVVGARGGAGKSTITALLALSWAALRQDTIAAIDAGAAPGTLGLRLGVPDAPAADDVVSALPPRVTDATALPQMFAVPRTGLLTAAGRRRDDSPAEPLLESLSRMLARHCAITLFDAPTGLDSKASRWCIGHAHAILFVTPATVAGIEAARTFVQRTPGGSDTTGAPVRILVVQADRRSPVSARAQAAVLRELPAIRRRRAAVQATRAVSARAFADALSDSLDSPNLAAAHAIPGADAAQRAYWQAVRALTTRSRRPTRPAADRRRLTR